MEASRWWDTQPGERYWLEITGRADLGSDLNAPALKETGNPYWSYDFVREVAAGDVVFHYRARPRGAITHWSRAIGEAYEDEVIWGAHGQAGGRGPVEPYPRAGWRHPLEGPYPLDRVIGMDELRSRETELREIRAKLSSRHPGASLYFPFLFSPTRPLRAFQGYLTRLPQELLGVFPVMRDAAEIAMGTVPDPSEPGSPSPPGLGTGYRPANTNVRTATRDPFSVDPDIVDRGLRAHAETQDALSAAVRAAGFEPRSPISGEPNFDLAWREGEAVIVAEVKSLTRTNEERQLRLALGQVLRYAELLRQGVHPVRAVIATERSPADPSWRALTESLGVTLVWPETFASLFD